MTTKNSDVFYERVSQWWRAHEFCDPAGVFCLEAAFEEAYVARAALRRLAFLGGDDGRESTLRTASPDALTRSDVTGDDERARLRQAVVAFCDRVVDHQGVQGPPPALFMGYGLKVANGLPTHSCVADQSSVATAVIEAIHALPDHPHASRWLECIERWAAWVMENFVQSNGGIGVGIYSHQWNPITEYWCATSLFAESLFELSTIRQRSEYVRVGTGALDWLAKFDFQKVEIPRFDEAPCEVILYAASGMVAGLERVDQHPVRAKLTEMIQWLAEHQQPDGNWPVPAGRGYRAYTMGIPWMLHRARELTPVGCAEKFWQFAASPAGEEYFGLYIRPWAMALAWFSAGERAGRR